MLLQMIQSRISSTLKRLVRSLTHLLLAFLLLFFDLLDEDLALILIQHFLTITLALRHRVRAFLDMESALGDFADGEELPRGHTNKPRRHPLIRQAFANDD
jgi:predicted PurR-regulated permease PerM